MKWIKKLALGLSVLACFTAAGCFGGTTCEKCVDDNFDHLCDSCHERIDGCTDLDHNHLCDTCFVKASDCFDLIADHECDHCGRVLSTCADVDGDNDCDICGSSLTPTVYEVKFYENGVLKKTVSVEAGEKINKESASSKEFYEFVGWKKGGLNGNFFDFDSEIESNLSLHAYYQLDYVAFTNELTSEYMDGIVSVHTQFVWSDWATYSSVGSGVIYAQDANYFYALTNNHVVYNYRTSVASGRSGSLKVRDAYDNEYVGTLLCYDKEYDLAVVRFTKNSNNRFQPETFAFAASNPVAGQEIAAVGSPHGQKNAISYGKIDGYDSNCQINDTSSSIDFSCIKHDAWLDNGSSGGLLMDTNFKIVGINFAIRLTPQEEFSSALAIPVQKVREFLIANNQLHGA